MIYTVLVYFSLFSNGLVNQWDGIWEYNYYKAGRWSISCGRWLWPYLDRVRMGISVEPITTILTCALFVAGFTFILYFLNRGYNSKRLLLLAAFIFLGSAPVCISLTYRFMSPTYGFAFLFAVLATMGLSRNSLIGIKTKKDIIIETLLCAFLIAAQMGLYQAYIGCTALLAIILLLDRLSDKETGFKEVVLLMVRFLISLILGGILYIIGLKIHLKIAYTTLSEYKGGSEYSVINTFRNLGSSIKAAYVSFWNFFFGSDHRYMIFMKNRGFYFVFMGSVFLMLLAGIIILIIRIYKQDIRKGVMSTVLFVLIPLATNLVMLIATGANLSLQMTVSLALVIPMILCLLQSKGSITAQGKTERVVGAVQYVVIAVILYGVVMQTEVDQEAMRTGMISVTQMAEEITADLREEGILSANKKICIVGVPSENNLYYLSRACEGANLYALFGAWGGYSDRQSWGGVFHHLLGLNVEMASNSEYDSIKGNPELAEMPCFPEAGYIREIDGIAVIKASPGY
ncbi:MAG: glucosyltransferase domain-containing protein [Lachnospiraceae bacterium]|nr:glucosyltransferase domain-containing protein [Lachnospiraceae bacterium]